MNNNLEKIRKYRKIRNQSIFSGCILQDDTCNGVSHAHSLQENGILNRLARNSMVLTIDFSKSIADKGKVRLHEVAISKASTFTGFCNNHDSKVFKPIEANEYTRGNLHQNYLFAYRAFALGYYERYSSYQMYRFRLQEAIEQKLNSINKLESRVKDYEEHLKLIERLKNTLNSNLRNGRFDRITTDLLIWPSEYGIASTSMFFLGRDNIGNIINSPDSYMTPIFFTIFPQQGFTFVLLSYLTKDKNRYTFINSQIVNVPIEQQKIIVSNLIATYIENIHISPDYWDSLPDSIKSKYYEIFNSSLGNRKPPRLAYYSDFNLFWKVI
ncbi:MULTISPECIES: hypothetical protein [Paenibacillus]|uniref:hypothetical protein n=1 Tax=Paenibacillus TaxID=44249 RepID=UPI002FE2F18D